MFITKRQYREWYLETVEENDELTREVVREADRANAFERALINARALIEQFQSSPEIKADTEAAFRRGENHARRALRNWLATQASSLEDLPPVVAVS